jgi:hypothetical protein
MSVYAQALLDEVARFSAWQERSAPIAAQLHVGELAWARIKASSDFRTPDESPPTLLAKMYGVPIVVGAGRSALPLDPYGWRLLDRDDNVISEGVLEPTS